MKTKSQIVIALLIALSLLLSAIPVFAGPNGNANGQDKVMEKLKLVEKRQAAAAALQAAGITVTAAALVTDPNTGHMVPDYFGVANWAFTKPLAKFVDALPMLVVGTPDTLSYPGTDYYEIELGQYEQKMHSSLPPTTLRGYRQVNGVGTPYSYLGPVIVAQKDRPVRIKFINSLPTGAGGNLFIPVDETIMGAGMGPLLDGMGMMTHYTQNRATLHLHGNNTVWISDGTPYQWITPAGENTMYPQGVSVYPVPDMGAGTAANDTGNPADGVMTFYYTNAQSARLMFYHDHALGITRLNVYAGEAAGYLITDAVESDLINGTNVTGVNPGLLKVLPDLGIPLVIQDKTFVDSATIGLTDPTWLDPTQPTLGTSHIPGKLDPAGLPIVPGTPVDGDLWYPHVYMPVQNPAALDGMNPFGRWPYGPWFFPPVLPQGSPLVPGSALKMAPRPNPYYDPLGSTPWENPEIPGVPDLSWAGEAFMDTPVVNGMAYPFLDVEPRAYRFRILNAADDRMLNLQMYVANPGIVASLTTTPGAGYTADPVVYVTNAPGDTTGHGFTVTAAADLVAGSPTQGQVTFTIQSVGSNYTLPPIITVTPLFGDVTGAGASATAVLYSAPTEVGMVPIPPTEPAIAPYMNSGMPDPGFSGPHFWMIGTEGGFKPAPVDVPNQHVTMNLNVGVFNMGTVLDKALMLGTAERADVVVDFSAFAGKTIILYNDAPAPFPAADPRTDYYTCNADQTSTGGAPGTLPGFGPNTRTIMQFRVGTTVTTPTPDVTFANLQYVWAKDVAIGKKGVFETAQPQIVVPQAAYNSAYGATYPATATGQYIQTNAYTKTFQPIDPAGVLQPAITMPIQSKAIHDEMGGVWDPYGRLSGLLGVDVPKTNANLIQFVPYKFGAPPVDLLSATLPGTPIGSLEDGTQIWRINQHGVDTHTIHTHLFEMQIINRVDWSSQMLPPDDIELGWKDTVRVNPLEMIHVAVRPITYFAGVPWVDKIPNDVRLIDPTMPDGAFLDPPPLGWFDPAATALLPAVYNHVVNFGWDYVWHCHILAHEDMDMMHSLSVAAPPAAPSNLAATETGTGKATAVVLTWTDNSANESGFVIQRAADPSFTNPVRFTVGQNVTTYSDVVGNDLKKGQVFFYRVLATNVVGDVTLVGWPTMTKNSGPSNLTAYPIGTPVIPPADPTSVAALAANSGTRERVTVGWALSPDAQMYNIQIATDSAFTGIVEAGTVTAPAIIYESAQLPKLPYFVRVQAVNIVGASAWVNATPAPVPAAP